MYREKNHDKYSTTEDDLSWSLKGLMFAVLGAIFLFLSYVFFSYL